MKITLLSVGKQNVSYLSEGESIYLKRLKHYVPVNQVYVPAEKISKTSNPQLIMEAEADRLLSKLPDPNYLIVLDERGTQVSSRQLAKKFEDFQLRSLVNVVFIIGGPLGLSEKVRKKANWVMSLSKMTLMHDMVPLILLEQMYRAFSIIRGEKYHK